MTDSNRDGAAAHSLHAGVYPGNLFMVVAPAGGGAAWAGLARDMWALREGLAIDALPHLLNFDMSLPMAGLDTFAACCDAVLRAHGPHAACLCVGMPATATCTSACRSPICPRTARTASSALSTGSCARWANR